MINWRTPYVEGNREILKWGKIYKGKDNTYC